MRRPSLLVAHGLGRDPYEPLERAVQVINRVISVGQKAQWGSKPSDGGGGGGGGGGEEQGGQERWVQFGAVSSSQAAVQEPEEAAPPQDRGWLSGDRAASGGRASSSGSGQQPAGGGGAAGRSLREYLALPVEEYSLLDPKWISREEGGAFRFSIPLSELVGVDLCPSVLITVHSDRAARRVTLVGTRAALGSPEVDAAFKLNLVAVLSERRQRRLSLPRPTHLPGRPVYRLRRWAARARGRQWPPPEDTGNLTGATGSAAPAPGAVSPAAGAAAGEAMGRLGPGGGAGAAAEAVALESLDPGVIDVEDPGTAAPFPADLIYYSTEGDPLLSAAEEAAAAAAAQGLGGEDGAALSAAMQAALEADLALPALEEEGEQQEEPETEAVTVAAAAGGVAAPAGSAPAPSSQLHCRVNLSMAVRVPGPLRVVPNALLGYAGSLILRAVLSAALPNFVELLAGDYQRWTEAAGGEGGRDVDAPLGDIFSQPAAGAGAAQGSRGP